MYSINEIRFSFVIIYFSLFISISLGFSYPSKNEINNIQLKNLHPLFSHFLPTESLQQLSVKSFGMKEGKEKELVPVVIIPSLLGNQIEAKLSNAETVHWYCFNNADWYSIFLEKTQFYPEVINCFTANFKLQRSVNGNYTSKRKGVSYRIPGFGDTKTAEYLDKGKTIPLWAGIVNILKAKGYTEGKNLRAATYDWRFGPDGIRSWFVDTKALIEETYALNGNKPVATVSLSMGGPYFVLFCNTVSQEWKDKYIQSFTSLSGAFGGSSIAAASLAMKFSQYGGLGDLIKPMSQTWGSIPFLMPAEEIFGNLQVASVNGTHYSGSNFTNLFRDASLPVTLEIYRGVKRLQKMSFGAPGVKVNCVYGTDIMTPAAFVAESWNKEATVSSFGPGDGTCLDEGLKICNTWGAKQKNPVFVFPIFNMTHADALGNMKAISVFLKELNLL